VTRVAGYSKRSGVSNVEVWTCIMYERDGLGF